MKKLLIYECLYRTFVCNNDIAAIIIMHDEKISFHCRRDNGFHNFFFLFRTISLFFLITTIILIIMIINIKKLYLPHPPPSLHFALSVTISSPLRTACYCVKVYYSKKKRKVKLRRAMALQRCIGHGEFFQWLLYVCIYRDAGFIISMHI